MQCNPKQLEAINSSDQNILVSAGAGSGKTMVLSERVMRILTQYVRQNPYKKGSIDRLLILTFTNNAAHSMRQKIKTKLIERTQNDPSLNKQLAMIDSADITTFDSFYQKIVKRYFYKIGIDKNFTIVNSSLLTNELYKIAREEFDALYDEKNEVFFEILNKFTTKKDEDIFNGVIAIVKSQVNMKENQLTLEQMENDPTFFFPELKKLYDLIGKEFKGLIQKFLAVFNSVDDDDPAFGKYRKDLMGIFQGFDKCTGFDQVKQYYMNFKAANLRKRSKQTSPIEDEVKTTKHVMQLFYAKIKNLPNQSNFENITRDNATYLKFIYHLANKIRLRLLDFKMANNVFEFSDISNFAISLVENDPIVRDEIKNSYDEIMVDEYQDNNDMQEKLLRLISNDNLFMVGDVKQSIYGFRNSNPSFFMKRYRDYKNHLGGKLIDMNQNYRSTKEVINDINSLFSVIMKEDFGGSDYEKEHKIIADNPVYKTIPNPLITKSISYQADVKDFDNASPTLKGKNREAVLICEDIVRRVNAHEKIGPEQKEIQFSDFCILMDRGKTFSEMAKVFKSYRIPLKIENDDDSNSTTMVMMLSNLVQVYCYMKLGVFNTPLFKKALYSVLRSPFFKVRNDELNAMFANNTYLSCDLCQKIYEIIKTSSNFDINNVFLQMVEEFDLIDSMAHVDDITASFQFFLSYKELIAQMATLHYSPQDVIDYLGNLSKFEDDKSLATKIRINNGITNAVTLTNIHKSKGLEYNIVYMAGLGVKYVTNSIKPFTFNSDYGFILPLTNKDKFDFEITDEVSASPLRLGLNLLEDDNVKQERIRLFYVQLTRAKYQMVFVEDGSKYDSFNHVLSFCDCFEGLISYASASYQQLGYDLVQSIENPSHLNVIPSGVKPLNLNYTYSEFINNASEEVEVKKRASKEVTHLDKRTLEFGTYVHKCLEALDFTNPDYSLIKDQKVLSYIKKFISSDLIQNHIHDTMYHEYSFFDEERNSFGSVDLLIVSKDSFTIVDYKLKNISDEAYLTQLQIYKENMERIFSKSGECYLYSLIDSIAKKIC